MLGCILIRGFWRSALTLGHSVSSGVLTKLQSTSAPRGFPEPKTLYDQRLQVRRQDTLQQDGGPLGSEQPSEDVAKPTAHYKLQRQQQQQQQDCEP